MYTKSIQKKGQKHFPRSRKSALPKVRYYDNTVYISPGMLYLALNRQRSNERKTQEKPQFMMSGHYVS